MHYRLYYLIDGGVISAYTLIVRDTDAEAIAEAKRICRGQAIRLVESSRIVFEQAEEDC